MWLHNIVTLMHSSTAIKEKIQTRLLKEKQHTTQNIKEFTFATPKPCYNPQILSFCTLLTLVQLHLQSKAND